MNTVARGLLGYALAGLLLASCGGSGPPQAPTGSEAQRLSALPDDAQRHGVRLFPASGSSSSWEVWRIWPGGEIRVYRRDLAADQPRVRIFPQGRQTLPLRVLESDGALYMFVYDTEANIPPGRDPNVVREGIDIYRFDSVDEAAPNRVAQGLALGGLDNLIHARVHAGVITACAVDRCYAVAPSGQAVSWDAAALADREIVDLRFDGEEAWALLRPKADHVTGNAAPGLPNYLIGRLGAASSSAQALPDDCVPYGLHVDPAGPVWSCAQTTAELAQVLNEDLARMPHQGLMEFGSTNAEGRIAWSAGYYLRAMLHLASGHTPQLVAAGAWPGIEARLREEIETLARLGSDGPMGYVSRRYSRNRVPLLFALHLGRIAHVLNSARELGFCPTACDGALSGLHTELAALQQTVEMPLVEIQAGQSFQTFALRRGSAFWADGANAPYNYLSGSALGVLASTTPTDAQVRRATDLMLPLQVLESTATADIWHYWWGHGYSGWTATDQISTNTPGYVGQTSWAHIAYRSIDAMALVRLHAVAPSAVSIQTIENVRRLVGSGQLLPFVNEELVRIGARVGLPAAVALRFSRSASPWELQAQIWALEALALP